MYYLIIFLISLLLAITVTPFIKKIAYKINFLDHPGGRKTHKKSTPLLGGIAIYFSFLIALICGISFNGYGYSSMILTLLSGGTVILATGLYDDKNGMSPIVKLCGQTLAALLFIIGSNVNGIFPITSLTVIISVLWIVGLINAFNFLDNMDGLAAGVSFIVSCAFFILGILNNQLEVAILAIALAGAILGFLKHNFIPASIFLGDAGSMFIGYMFATLSLLVTSHEKTSFAVLTPVIILAYPLFDISLVFITRIQDGRKFYKGGRDHSSHRIYNSGLSALQTILFIYFISLLVTTAALLIKRFLPLETNILAVTVIGIIFICFGIDLSTVRIRSEILKDNT